MKSAALRFVLAAALALVGGQAFAKGTFTDADGASHPGVVAMCLDSAGVAIPAINAAQCAGGGGGSAYTVTFGGAIGTLGTPGGFKDGSNLFQPFTGSSGNLNVNCTVGCSGGSFNNNADNVATSSTNGQAAAWLYVWDGTAWDRLYGDQTNGAFVQIKAGSIGNTSFGATQATASNLNAQVQGPGATGAALSGNPVRVAMSDGTNTQNWLAAIALADGVNGNNTGAVANWLWNGTTYDRARGDLTNGAFVNVKTSVLPTSAATSTKQSDGTQKTQIVDGSGNVIAATSNALNVNISSGNITGFATSANQSTIITALNTLNTNVTNPIPLNVNGVPTAQTGLTPAVTQTGTIVAANVDLTSMGGVAFGAMANYGTSPGAVKVPGANAFVTNFGTGTAGTPGGGVVTVQGAASMTPVATNVTQVLGAALSATNGLFSNILQGNAVLSATNGIYSNMLIGNAAVATGTGAQGSTTPRFAVATDQATNAGAALVKGGVGVVNGGSTYNHVAASATAQALTGGGGGATGDYLSHCVIYPSTTGAGSVTVFDNTNSAANNVIEFVTGTLSNLAPIAIPVGAVSVNGPWKATTGANETMACYGKFT